MPVMPKITDVRVTIDVLHPQTVVGLTNPAIFVSGSKQSYTEYHEMDDLAADFAPDTSVYKTANAIFAQADAPELVAVINYVPAASGAASTPEGVNSKPTGSGAQVTASATSTGNATADSLTGIEKAAADYFYKNWEFALLDDFNQADALALADAIENGGYDGKGYHILFLQFADATLAKPFAKYTRTFTFYHTDATEYYAAALIGEASSQTIGKTSWKFVGDLQGITAEDKTPTEIDTIQKAGCIAYVTKGTHSNQTDDSNASGTYIDFIHGLDCAKSMAENNLQGLLNQSGFNRLQFSAAGISLVSANLTATMDTLFGQGVIAPNAQGKGDYTVTTKPFGQLNAADVARRTLNGVSFSYTPAGAINKINVRGTVTESEAA